MHASPSASTPRGTPSRRGKSPRFSSDSMPQPGSSTLPATFSNKAPATFISSLEIPVEGAIPIETEPEKAPTANGASHSKSNDSQRAPRKSKTEAMTAMNNQARSSSAEVTEDEDLEYLAERYRNAPPIPVSPKFNLSSVKTPNPNRSWKQPLEPRPLGLEDCPEFFPTAEEFKDPMAYIKSISDKAQDYGICKIIPPQGWKMPFVTDTETFRFKTRLQRLNSIEASSRAKLNFLEQLYRFHKQQGNPRVAVPTINHKPLDLWLLRKEVQRLGGYDAVTKGKKWSDLGRILGYRGIPGLSTQIKNSYTRVILPFEHFCERVKNSPALSPLFTRDAHLKTHTNIQGSSSKSTKLDPSPTEGMTTPGSPTTSSPLSEPPDESERKDGKTPRRSARMSSIEQSPRKGAPVVPAPTFHDKPDRERPKEEQHCEICHKKNRGEEMLLCDGCDCGFHMFCLDPPLSAIPKEQWFCFTCLAGTGGDFGFDEGADHSLSTFQARDLEFRKLWFETHPPPGSANRMVDDDDPTVTRIGNVYVSEDDVENEFWRLVASPNETVEIEYGADVHSTTHGSAMPTMETHPLNSYSKDPWNLNNIPILPDSLLRYIKSDISGMTVPWTYVGMAFSTFCWHNEDHYTYSINYMHWGETKTWYGIPGEDAEKFEAAIKREAPDLFEAQPDLLFQLVTLMNPTRLSDEGVRVYRCNQRAGEFVITFPKAYHAGFNHGLNFNEAVNFALPDWLPLGRECIKRYREHRKLPVFSQDELLITITQQSQSIKTAMWLIDSLREMTEREFDDRQKARAKGLTEILKEEDSAEDQYQCHICKTFCYLSQVVCQCTTRVVCADHIDLLCENRPSHNIVLRKRCSDEELQETLSRVAERAAIPSAWRTKLHKLLMESARPSLRSLRALLAEGDRINFPLPEMVNLRKCVTRANEWVDFANSFLIRKQSRKRTARKSRGAAGAAPEDPNDRPDRGLDELYTHLREVEVLGFDCPEIATLKNLAQQAEDTKTKAAKLLKATPEQQEQPEFLQDCKRIQLEGSSLNVVLEELAEVEKIVEREQLISELDEKLDDDDEPTLTLEEVRQYLARARNCGLSLDNKHMKFLESRQKDGDSWQERANALLEKPVKTIPELDEFADMDPNIPIDPATVDRLKALRSKALDFKKQAKQWLTPSDDDSPKPRISEVLRLCQRCDKDFKIAEVIELRRTAEIAIDLENRCEQVLRGRFVVGAGEDLFKMIEGWRDYVKKHLTMFIFPAFDKVCEQVTLHGQWVRELPWFCKEHGETHSGDTLRDVLDNTRPEDDTPPTDEYMTCICNQPVRPPPPGVPSDAVQCDHCFARFHGDCAKNGGSCPFCDHHHWNGTIHKKRSYHFCFLPELLRRAPEITRHYSRDYQELDTIVARVDRLSAAIGQFLSYTSQPINQRPEYLPTVKHFMRKLYRIQFAVSPNPDISYGLDLAGLHRILATRPAVTRPKKRRRPRFTFGQDVDADWSDGTRCICRSVTPFLLNKPKVECSSCSRLYHVGCVFFPQDENLMGRVPLFYCPICCLKKGRRYEFSDIRVRPVEGLGPKVDPDVYVNTEEMIEIFSRELIYKRLPPPSGRTLFVDLVSWTPGSDQSTSSVPASSRSSVVHQPLQPHQPHLAHQPHHPHQALHGVPPMPVPVPVPVPMHPHVIPLVPPPARVPHGPPPHHGEQIMQMTAGPTLMYAPSSLAPPPPTHGAPAPHCWSRWGTVSTPSMPPQTQKRTKDADARSRNGTPQPGTSRKRKQPEEEKANAASSSSGPNAKRRAAHSSSTPSTQASSRAPSSPPLLAAPAQSHVPTPTGQDPAIALSPAPGSVPGLVAAPTPVPVPAPPAAPVPVSALASAVVAQAPPPPPATTSPTVMNRMVSPVSPVARPVQILSPSLAMIVSPTNEEPQTSPRVAFTSSIQRPSLPTANGSSPLVPTKPILP